MDGELTLGTFCTVFLFCAVYLPRYRLAHVMSPCHTPMTKAEEEDYTTRVIHYFSSGLIALPEGKTLRVSLLCRIVIDFR